MYKRTCLYDEFLTPLASFCPRKSLVPCCVQWFVTNLWLYGQPLVARSIGGLWRSCLSDSILWMEQLPNHISWFYTNPYAGFLSHSFIPLPTSASLFFHLFGLVLLSCTFSSAFAPHTTSFLNISFFGCWITHEWLFQSAFTRKIFSYLLFLIPGKSILVPFSLTPFLVSGTVSISFWVL